MKANKALLLVLGLVAVFCFCCLAGVSATCWDKTTSALCTADSSCNWRNDSWSTSGWCEEKNCWALYTQSDCSSANIPGKNCSWSGGQTTYWCEKLTCYSLSGTSASQCANNSLGLNCQWSNTCYPSGGYAPGVNCYDYTNQSACLNATSCSWGNCNEVDCWTYTNSSNCVAAKDPWNGRNCTWSNDYSYCSSNYCGNYWQNSSYCVNGSSAAGLNCQWRYSSCQDIDCWTWDYTNETACVNNTQNLSCTWNINTWGGGGWCQKQDCWNYATQSTCQNKTGCNWKAYTSSGWCQEVNCWSWDSWSGGSNSSCIQNASIYGLNCIWSGNPSTSMTNGWCYKDWTNTVSCGNKSTERDCVDTYYCWWQYTDWNNPSAGGNCSEPGGFGTLAGTALTILNDWNPGCYIFDTNATDCNSTLGCNYSTALGKCLALSNAYGGNISLNGLNCTYINNSNLCNSISVLSSCCSWQNASCTINKLSTACWDQMQTKSEDNCEDADTEARCLQIAGSPWYMPCQWSNVTDNCMFKASDVFGNESQSLTKIDNKKTCEAAGGKWFTENYCEGNISVPTGRCEYKFSDEDDCDKACFACELKNSDGTAVNSSNAATACVDSKLAICEFEASTRAPNGIGYCKSKSQFKKGIAGDCNSNCGDCTFKGDRNNNDTTKRSDYFCSHSTANAAGGGCKWITDNTTTTGGYCVKTGEKTCEDTCDRCNTQSSCVNTGRTAGNMSAGACKWEGESGSTTGKCILNIGESTETCWDGLDNNDNNLVDCADKACYSDPFCGFTDVGSCSGWTTNTTCINNGCEWAVDKWGTWCDVKGSQCWKYDFSENNCSAQSNCEWHNGTSASWCEQDWSHADTCMGLSRATCLTTSGCNWTVDSWCAGQGNTTDWCVNNGGWCEYILFKSKNCWQYNAGSSQCNSVSGCNWHNDSYSQPHCEVNYTANCWNYYDSTSCAAAASCRWRSDSWGGWCTNMMDKCWSSSDQGTCDAQTDDDTSARICYWESWGTGMGYCQPLCSNSSYSNSANCGSVPGCVWKAENGWCEESYPCTNSSNTNNQQNCQGVSGIASGCRWKSSGYCDPRGGGFSTLAVAGGGGMGGAIGANCYKYDGNQSFCTNKTLINITCGWTVNSNPTCEVNWNTNCAQYMAPGAGGCNSTNLCWFKNDTWGASCMSIMEQCWSNTTYQSWNNPAGWAGNCSANTYCTNNSWGSCEPRCFNSSAKASAAGCIAITGCKWSNGWCNPGAMNDMFDSMESGAPAPLGMDTCPESPAIQASVDLCGFGMRDMGDSYGFGAGMMDFSNASVCNKETLSSFVMGGGGQMGGGPGMGGASTQERKGTGNDTVIYIVYLDADGSTSGGCDLDNDATAVGYEFKLKYRSQWNANTSKADETFNAYKCDDGEWKATDIKLSAWKKKMCSEIGGMMIAVQKADLARFPALYDSTRDLRVYVATYANETNMSLATDTAGPGWTTPGAIDFEITGAFEYGADTAKYEDILKKGYVAGEDCFNSVDDDGDGSADCNDWDCQYSSKCEGTGVAAASYIDTSSPLVTGVKIEEYPGAVLIMYDTNKPANGTLEWYGADSTCSNGTSGEPGVYVIPDMGIVTPSKVRTHKLWHVAAIYQGATKLNASAGNFFTYDAPVVSGTNGSYYKLKVCDANNKCAVSKCSSFKLPTSVSRCGYCNFVTRIKVPTGWKVAYDVNRDGTYEHVQGDVCGPNAGMKSNYTDGRKVNVKLYKSDGSVYIEFLNASLTKTALNDKVRTISESGDLIHDTSTGTVGMISGTRDKILNSLHPEVCRIKIPSSGACDRLYHCDDNGANCVDRTTAAGGAPIDATNCVWNIPYCEFSTYKTSSGGGGTTTSGAGGGAGGGAAAVSGATVSVDLSAGAQSVALGYADKAVFTFAGVEHYIKVDSVGEDKAILIVGSTPVSITLLVGEYKSLDLDGDDSTDLKITLNSLETAAIGTARKAKLTLELLPKALAPTGKAVAPPSEIGKKAGEAIQAIAKKGLKPETLLLAIAVIALIAVLGYYFYTQKETGGKKKGKGWF